MLLLNFSTQFYDSKAKRETALALEKDASAQRSARLAQLAVAERGRRVRVDPTEVAAMKPDRFEAFTMRERGFYSIRPFPGATCFYARTG